MSVFDVFCFTLFPVCIFDIVGAIYIYKTVYKKEFENNDYPDKK